MSNAELDERAIARVLAEYCHLVDDANIEALLDRFTDDAVFVFSGQETVGRSALTDYFAATVLPQHRGKHLTSNIVIDVDGDCAMAASDFLFLKKTSDGLSPRLTGRYNDDLRRTNDRWQICRRTVTLH